MFHYLLTLLLFSTILLSAPAFRGTKVLTQNDGVLFEAKIEGDEYLHWIETVDGYFLIYNRTSKNYEYATIKNGSLVPSGRAYSKVSKERNVINQNLSKREIHNLWIEKREKGLNY